MADEQSPIKIKKIGHVVLNVSDIERSSKFWTEIMGFKFSDRNEIGMMFFRNATDHHTVALLQAKEKNELPKRGQVGFDHMALEVATVSELFKIRDFLRSKGVEIFYEGRHKCEGDFPRPDDRPIGGNVIQQLERARFALAGKRRGPGGNPGVEFYDPDGYKIEIYAAMDQIGTDGKSRPANEWKRATTLEEAVENPLPGAEYS